MTDSASVDLGGRSILAISQCFNVWNVSPEKSDVRRLEIRHYASWFNTC